MNRATDATELRCTRCGETKPRAAFRLLAGRWVSSWCRSCAVERTRQWRAEHREAVNERARTRYRRDRQRRSAEFAEWHRAERHETALHEAGHAVADVVLGIPIEYASIRPGRHFAGIAVPARHDLADADRFEPWLDSVALQPAALRADVERRVIALLAGPIAALYLVTPQPAARYDDDGPERIAREALARLGPRLAELVVEQEEREDPFEHDEDKARDLAAAFAGPDAGFLYQAWLQSETRALVLRYRREILAVAGALEREAVLAGEAIAALVYPKGVPMRIRKPKVDPEAYFTCLDSFVGPLGGARQGEIRKGSDPLVAAHPGLWASGVLVGEDFRAARLVYTKAQLARPLPEPAPPTTSSGAPIILLGPIPPERRMRCIRTLWAPVGTGTVKVYSPGSIYDANDPWVRQHRDYFEPAAS